MDLLTSLFARNGFLPHGSCFTWTPGLLWTMVGADAVIAAAYFSIPLAIARFVQAKGLDRQRGIAALFGAFILACGITHVLDIWTIWQPDYALQALAKAVTAAVSIATAIALWPLIPRLLRLPSVGQLQAAVSQLEAEVRQRRSAEQHLTEVQRTLAITLGSIGAGYISTDAQGMVMQMNEVAEQVSGWTQAQAQGLALWAVLQPDGDEAPLPRGNPVQQMVERGTTLDHVQRLQVRSRDGRPAVLEVQAALIHDDAGQVRGLTAVFRDMTRLTSAEAELRRMAAIVESSNDAIISKTMDGHITGWNRAAQQLFGYTADEIIGQPVQRLLPPDRQAEEMRILADLVHGRTVPPFDTVRQAKDGRLVPVSVTISPIRDAVGRIVGGSKIARDISQQQRAEAIRREAEAARGKSLQLEAENRQIQKATQLKSLFLANMSHELRTPLNAIIGFADLLHSGAVPVDSPKHREFLGHVGSSGRHLLQLINDVLDLSKVESGKFEFAPEPVQLPRLLQEVGQVLHTAILRKHLVLDIAIAPGLDDLVLDPARLKQVLFNYLSNAIKFTADGGRISVRAQPEGADLLRIEVEDTGIGIAAADVSRLFVEFQQLDAGLSKQHQGTGLGLALTRRLVQAQGGDVGVRSVPGLGSVFHLVLPRHPVRPAEGDAALAPATRRLLVIEHDATLRQQTVQGLQQAGYQVDAVATGREAERQASGRPYDAITLGLQLADQPGLDTLAHIRNGGPNHDAPVLGVTMAAPGGAAGFAVANVLSKPIRTGEVVAAMARLALPGHRQACVAVVDDDPLARDLMQATLRAIGIEAVGFSSGQAALAALAQLRPDAMVLDLMMPGFDGFAVLDALHQLPAGGAPPVLIWTSLVLSDDEYALLARSAQAIVSKGGGALTAMLAQLHRECSRASQALSDEAGL